MSQSFSKDARIAWCAIGSAVVVLVIFILWHRSTQEPELDIREEETTIVASDEQPFLESSYPARVSLSTDSGPALFVDKNEVRVKDQEAGGRVFISQVSLMQSGWVAVRELAGSAYGNILGAARFDAGVWQGEVRLLRATIAGNMYAAVMYQDDGDGIFDHQKDTMVLFEDAPVSMLFSAY